MDLLSLEQAKKNVEHYLDKISTSIGMELVIIENDTRETNNSFIFIYNSKKFIINGHFSSALAGNSPLFVDKKNGKIYESGTAHPIEYYIDRYEKGDMNFFNEIS